jgi:flagellar biogenesis protein FliO
VTAQYLNFFVLIVQLFLKVPALKALAPTQTEPAFAVSQLLALLFFVGIGVLAVIRFRPRGETRQPSNAVSARHSDSFST